MICPKIYKWNKHVRCISTQRSYKNTNKIPTFSYFKDRKIPTFSYFGMKIPTFSYFFDLSYYFQPCKVLLHLRGRREGWFEWILKFHVLETSFHRCALKWFGAKVWWFLCENMLLYIGQNVVTNVWERTCICLSHFPTESKSVQVHIKYILLKDRSK